MRHAWRLLGAASGWEVYECTLCGRSAIPSVFAWLWPDFFYRVSFGRLGRCEAMLPMGYPYPHVMNPDERPEMFKPGRGPR